MDRQRVANASNILPSQPVVLSAQNSSNAMADAPDTSMEVPKTGNGNLVETPPGGGNVCAEIMTGIVNTVHAMSDKTDHIVNENVPVTPAPQGELSPNNIDVQNLVSSQSLNNQYTPPGDQKSLLDRVEVVGDNKSTGQNNQVQEPWTESNNSDGGWGNGGFEDFRARASPPPDAGFGQATDEPSPDPPKYMVARTLEQYVIAAKLSGNGPFFQRVDDAILDATVRQLELGDILLIEQWDKREGFERLANVVERR